MKKYVITGATEQMRINILNMLYGMSMALRASSLRRLTTRFVKDEKIWFDCDSPVLVSMIKTDLSNYSIELMEEIS
jgi:hypothetical protein